MSAAHPEVQYLIVPYQLRKGQCRRNRAWASYCLEFPLASTSLRKQNMKDIISSVFPDIPEAAHDILGSSGVFLCSSIYLRDTSAVVVLSVFNADVRNTSDIARR